MRPDLGDIEGVETVLLGILRLHDLNVDGPRRILTVLNSVEEITGGIIRVGTSKLTSLISLQVSDTLISLEVPLDILEATIFSNQLESVRRVTVEVTVTVRSTTVGEEDGDLVNGFRDERQEIPEGIGITTVGLRVSLLGVDEVYNLSTENQMSELYF